MTTYTGVVNGVPVNSNIPLDVPPPHGNYLYQTQLNFKVPVVNALAEVGMDFESVFDPSALESQLNAQLPDSTISNVKITTPNSTSVLVTFNATSPMILVYIGILIVLLIVLAYLVEEIIVTVSNISKSNPILGGSIDLVLVGIGILAIVGAGLILYDIVAKKRASAKKFKQDVKIQKAALERRKYAEKVNESAMAEIGD